MCRRKGQVAPSGGLEVVVDVRLGKCIERWGVDGKMDEYTFDDAAFFIILCLYDIRENMWIVLKANTIISKTDNFLSLHTAMTFDERKPKTMNYSTAGLGWKITINYYDYYYT